MWNELYFAPPMQNLIAWFNSIPIYGVLALIGYVARSKTWGKLLLYFSLAALIHIAGDMPVHSDDAYRHFWPISDWRFYSPLSYWDVDHHARWVGKIDVAIAGIYFDQGLARSKFTTGLRGDCHRSAGTENACRYGNGEAR